MAESNTVKIGSTNKIVQPIYNQPDRKVNSVSNLHLGISHMDTDCQSVPFISPCTFQQRHRNETQISYKNVLCTMKTEALYHLDCECLCVSGADRLMCMRVIQPLQLIVVLVLYILKFSCLVLFSLLVQISYI